MPTYPTPRPQVNPSAARWCVELIIGNDDKGETTDAHLYFGGADAPGPDDWPFTEGGGWQILSTEIRLTPQGTRVPWRKRSGCGFDAIMSEVRTNEPDADTAFEWIWALNAAHIILTGRNGHPSISAEASPEEFREFKGGDYPTSMILEMAADRSEYFHHDDDGIGPLITPEDIAAALRIMLRYAPWLRMAEDESAED